MNIAILGFGTVGYGVYEMALKSDELKVKYVLDLVEHNDIEAKSVTDINVILNDPEVDTVVELIGGRDVALKFITASLNAGKNVITANKLVICENYKTLTALAVEKGVALRYTAAVGGGIPWLINLERTVRTSKVQSIEGILNGTTNYILDAMHKDGTDFADALKTAQQLGFAEADPSSDIDGLDTGRKIGISANIAFGVCVNPAEIAIRGIGGVTSKTLSDCEKHGYLCRLIATATNSEDGISAYTEPTLVKDDSSWSAVSRNLNRIEYKAENVGIGAYLGFGAGRYPTAYTVINDCIDVASGVKRTYNSSINDITLNNSAVSHCYYVAAPACDKLDPSLIKERWENGVVTHPQTVSYMHAFAKENDAFIAGIL